MQFFFWSRSLFLSFSIYFLASHSALGMQINRKRKLKSDNEAEKYLIMYCTVYNVHELPYTQIVKSGIIIRQGAVDS